MNYARKLVEGSLEEDDIETEAGIIFFNCVYEVLKQSSFKFQLPVVLFFTCMLGDGICRGT